MGFSDGSGFSEIIAAYKDKTEVLKIKYFTVLYAVAQPRRWPNGR